MLEKGKAYEVRSKKGQRWRKATFLGSEDVTNPSSGKTYSVLLFGNPNAPTRIPIWELDRRIRGKGFVPSWLVDELGLRKPRTKPQPEPEAVAE
jgi:hypothetical protein